MIKQRGRQQLLLVVSAMVACVFMRLAVAEANVGAAAGQTLLQPMAARPAALGEAFAGAGGHAESLSYNGRWRISS